MGIWSYEWEPHQVTTEDGYTLTLMRVTRGDKWVFDQYEDDGYNPVLSLGDWGEDPAHMLYEAFTNN